MDSELSIKVIEVLSSLEQQLGLAKNHFWPLLVKQQYISGIVTIIWTCLAGLVCYVAIKYAKFSENNEDSQEFIAMIGVIISFVVLAISFVCCTQVPGEFLNPEYTALKELMNMINK